MRSAGLRTTAGRPAEEGALRVAPEFGVSLDAHRSTPVDPALVDASDLILGFSGWHLAELQRRWPASRGRGHLLGDFFDAPPHRIDDPWGEPDEVFRETYRRIERGVAALAAHIARSCGEAA